MALGAALNLKNKSSISFPSTKVVAKVDAKVLLLLCEGGVSVVLFIKMNYCQLSAVSAATKPANMECICALRMLDAKNAKLHWFWIDAKKTASMDTVSDRVEHFWKRIYLQCCPQYCYCNFICDYF